MRRVTASAIALAALVGVAGAEPKEAEAEQRELALLGCHVGVLDKAEANLILRSEADTKLDAVGFGEVARRAWAAFLDGDLDRCLDLEARLRRWVFKGDIPADWDREKAINAAADLGRRLREKRRAKTSEYDHRFGPQASLPKRWSCEGLPDSLRAEAEAKGKAAAKKDAEFKAKLEAMDAEAKRLREHPDCLEPTENGCRRWREPKKGTPKR